MFSSRRTSDRRGSGSKTVEERKERSRRKIVSPKDLRITFENVMHSVSMYPSDVVEKDSVVRCIESMYNWMVFDSDMQLDLPIVPSSPVAVKMWPHGATIDTRRKTEADVNEKSSRKLRQLDEEAIFSIANSVVSSTFEEERPARSKGEVVIDMPRGEIKGQRAHAHPNSSSLVDRTAGRFTRVSPDMLQPAPVTARRAVPRYSVLEGTAPVSRAHETPDPNHAETYTVKRGKRPKVSAVKREEEDEGVPVLFAD